MKPSHNNREVLSHDADSACAELVRAPVAGKAAKAATLAACAANTKINTSGTRTFHGAGQGTDREHLFATLTN